ncbi:hypothetical protein PHJA_000211400 [Phtheirospermum japonicum]|uniref:Uncharacterized protein n=1 Tax=Phtheirospermum japonicum TaxID=374723 RepID=A0A830BF65_9LAMI|nr:hypothetical protein PHJA_000211400 [Phtheirospermum japonicum]
MSLSRHLFRPRASKSFVLCHFSTVPTSEPPASSRRNHHEFLPPTTYINSWKPSRNPKEAAAQLAFLRRDYDRKVKEMRKTYIEEMELQRIEKLRKDAARKEALRIANEERKAAKDAKKKAEAIERQAAQEEFRRMLDLAFALRNASQFHNIDIAFYVLSFFFFCNDCGAIPFSGSLLPHGFSHEPQIMDFPPLEVASQGRRHPNYKMKERAEKLEYWRMREKKIEEKKKEKNELLHRQSSIWVDESYLEKKVFEAVVDTASLENFGQQN